MVALISRRPSGFPDPADWRNRDHGRSQNHMYPRCAFPAAKPIPQVRTHCSLRATSRPGPAKARRSSAPAFPGYQRPCARITRGGCHAMIFPKHWRAIHSCPGKVMRVVALARWKTRIPRIPGRRGNAPDPTSGARASGRRHRFSGYWSVRTADGGHENHRQRASIVPIEAAVGENRQGMASWCSRRAIRPTCSSQIGAAVGEKSGHAGPL